MHVIKRNGQKQDLDVTKIREQINHCCEGINVNPLELEAKISTAIKTNMKTSDIQEMIILTATTLVTAETPQWSLVAGRLETYNTYREIYKNTKLTINDFFKFTDYAVKNGYYRKDFLDNYTADQVVMLAGMLNYESDRKLVLPQILSLRSKYLLKNAKGHIEYPQFAEMSNSMILASVEDEKDKMKTAKEYFNVLNDESVSLGTPFKANLRLNGGNTGSCFIMDMPDNLDGISKTWADMAEISKQGGGIGVYLGNLRPGGSASKNIPKANEITKWVKIINDICIAVNQRGIRKGAITPALDWWHLDIESFLAVKTETGGDLRDKSFDIFPQIVVDSYFVHKKEKNEDLYLFDQFEVLTKFNINVVDLIDEELFNAHLQIEQYIKEGKLKHFKKVNSKEMWALILETWIEIGDLYITHKDNLNMSNYLKADYIANSFNLCTESASITKKSENWSVNHTPKGNTTTSDGLYHSCSLISINVGVCLTEAKLKKACIASVKMLDASIDLGTMPIQEAVNSSQMLRNIGIGTLGVADWMAWNKLSYTKEEDLQKLEALQERIAYYCYEASIELAIKKGAYPACKDADYSTMFGKPVKLLNKMSLNGFDWVALADRIKKEGIRNFLLLATAPNSSCQSGFNKVLTNQGENGSTISTDIYTILEEQGFDKNAIEQKEPHWISLKEHINVPTYEGDAVVEQIWYNGIKPVYEIEFEDGKTYEFTANHKLLVKNADESIWVRVDELSALTQIVTSDKSSKEIKRITLQKEIPTYDFEVKEKHHYLLDNGVVSHNTGIVANATASYAPPQAKFNYQTLADMSVPIVPRYLADRYWFYKGKFQYGAHEIIEVTKRLQNWIDTGISMEVAINPELTNIKLISDAILDGFKKKKLKAVYYSITIDGKKESACLDCAN